MTLRRLRHQRITIFEYMRGNTILLENLE